MVAPVGRKTDRHPLPDLVLDISPYKTTASVSVDESVQATPPLVIQASEVYILRLNCSLRSARSNGTKSRSLFNSICCSGVSGRQTSGLVSTFSSSKTALRTASRNHFRRKGHIQIKIRICISLDDAVFIFKTTRVSYCKRTMVSGRTEMKLSGSNCTPYATARCISVAPNGLVFLYPQSASCKP